MTIEPAPRRAFLRGLGLVVPSAAAMIGASAAFAPRPVRADDMEGHAMAGTPAAAKTGGARPAKAASIVRPASDLPPPIGARGPRHVRFDLETAETVGQLADGTTYPYWTFRLAGEAPKVPGPFLRCRVGDTVELHLKNSADSTMNHNIDLHAVLGPHGGGMATECAPGEEKSFSFKAMKPGLFVYHCATAPHALHIASGMYGMILVEPEGGLAKVDREFYLMQAEVYTAEPYGTPGAATPSLDKVIAETPDYYVLNGAVGALTAEHPLKAKVGETIRVYFGVAGPNKAASFHVIGQIVERLYDQASLVSKPLEAVQTTTVAPGGAVVAEFKLLVPGTYAIVDHAIARLERGLKGALIVEGPENLEIFNPGRRTA